MKTSKKNIKKTTKTPLPAINYGEIANMIIRANKEGKTEMILPIDLNRRSTEIKQVMTNLAYSGYKISIHIDWSEEN